ncbi:MAG: hypothetical protein WCH34_16085 [Bacteroidota bacterium]
MKRYIVKFICIFLSVTTLWLFCNASINQHSHLINGRIITHSHPYAKDKSNNSPFQSHQHTSFELFLLDQIANPVTLLMLFLGISGFVFRRRFSYLIQYVSFVPKTDYLFFGNFRAPPALS